MTKRLFDHPTPPWEADAVVTGCTAAGENWAVALDRTVFFPRGGGQEGDRGVIGDSTVHNTVEQDGAILHLCNAPVEAGKTVHIAVDRACRFDRMQNHTAEHLLCGILHNQYGFDNVGFALNDFCVTLDINGVLSTEQLTEAERRANELICENRAVTVSFPTAKQLSALSYRSKSELTGQVRLVEIQGVDLCACCAPHVSSTGQIGSLRITDAMHYKGGMRLTMLAGMRALRYHQQLDAQNRGISRLLCVKPEQTCSGVERLIQENEALRSRAGSLERQMAELLAAQTAPGTENPCLLIPQLGPGAQRQLLRDLCEKCRGVCVLLCGDDTQGYRYLIGSREIPLRVQTSAINQALRGKGGGSDEMLQGTFSASFAEITAFFRGFSPADP